MATVIAAVVAAAVATFGYALTTRSKLLEDRRRTYAEALATVRAYQALPHRIRRRTDSTAATRGALGSLISDLQRDLDHYSELLEMDSEPVARAYRGLVAKARQKGQTYRTHAWRQPPAATDADMSYTETYYYNDFDERTLCVQRMRSRLKMLPRRIR